MRPVNEYSLNLLIGHQKQIPDERIKKFEMNEDKKIKLIDDVIQYIKTERKLYGDFASTHQPQKQSQASHSTKILTQPDTVSMPQNSKSAAPSNPLECNSLEELRALCAKADELKTDLEDTKLVFGSGDPNADLLIVGEAPGAEEDKQGKPFVGRGGQLLTKILEAADFDREEIYIANILKHRPPGNRNPLPEERKRSLPYLLRQIELVNPKIILSLGKVSAETLLGKNASLTSMRGKFHPFMAKYELMATYHPAALLRNPNWKRPTWDDFKMLRKRYDEVRSNE